MFKVVLVNVTVLFAMLFILLAAPAVIESFDMESKDRKSQRGKLPNYANLDWVDNYYHEQSRLKTEYYDFIGWRSKPFSGTAITVDDEGYRRHSTRLTESDAWFFGGSAMWGFGANNEGTIPALYQQAAHIKSFNFGERGYTAHQSLNLFQKLLSAGAKPKSVFFYDGGNEVAMKCRKELGFYSADYEMDFRSKIGVPRESFEYLFLPLITKLGKLFSGGGEDQYDCDSNPQKTRNIALALYYDWETARYLAQMNGAKFVAVLQPVAYQGLPNLSHLPKTMENRALARQYQAVYAEIRKVMLERKFAYVDLTGIYDGEEFTYIDFCHVTPNGNRKVADALARASHSVSVKTPGAAMGQRINPGK